MTAATKAALDTALADHFADAWDGAMLTGWVIQMAGVNAEDIGVGGQTSYYREVADGQPSHVTLGLLEYATTMFRGDLLERSQE